MTCEGPYVITHHHSGTVLLGHLSGSLFFPPGRVGKPGGDREGWIGEGRGGEGWEGAKGEALLLLRS